MSSTNGAQFVKDSGRASNTGCPVPFRFSFFTIVLLLGRSRVRIRQCISASTLVSGLHVPFVKKSKIAPRDLDQDTARGIAGIINNDIDCRVVLQKELPSGC